MEQTNKAKKTVSTTPPPDTKIVGLNNLFRSSQNEQRVDPVFPAGSTLVLSGPPGSGKTTMALSLVRAMQNKEKIIYFISTEVSRERLKGMYKPFSWFSDDDKLFDRPTDTRKSGLHVINPPVELERPVRSSDDTVNAVIREIRNRPQPEPDQYVYVIIDSVTALFKDCPNLGEIRRQTYELVHRINKAFDPKSNRTQSEMHLLILVAEEPFHSENPLGVESYLCDFVFRLGIRALGMGTRLRTLEVLKSIGVNLMMGVHTWLIVTRESIERVFTAKVLRDKIHANVAEIEGHPSPARWCTIVICSRPYIWTRTKPIKHKSAKQPCSVTGLAEMLTGDTTYWFHDDKQKHATFRNSCLPAGSVSVVTGTAGTAIISFALRLALSNSQNNIKGGQNTAQTATLVVCLENNLELALQSDSKTTAPPGDKIDFIHRGRSSLHFNLLLMEIREWTAAQVDSQSSTGVGLGKKRIRIVIDGVSNLSSTTTPAAFSRMLDALIQSIHENPDEDITMILTYEVPNGRPTSASEVLRLPADNIVQLQMDDGDPSKVLIQVLKSFDPNHDRCSRALLFPLSYYENCRIEDRNVNSQLTLELLNENHFEAAFNNEMATSISKTLSCDVTRRFFARPEINVNHSKSMRSRTASEAHAHVTQVDEWWIAGKVADPSEIGLINLMPRGKWRHSDRIVPTAKDFLIDEMDKAKASSIGNREHEKVFALPFYYDYGQMCLNSRILEEKQFNPEPFELYNHETKPKPWTDVSAEEAEFHAKLQEQWLLPWCTQADLERGPFSRKSLIAPSVSQTIFSTVHSKLFTTKTLRVQSGRLQYGVAWDSQTTETNVAFFFELCWAFGGMETLFESDPAGGIPVYFDHAVRALMYMIAANYAPPHPTLSDTVDSIYSRHFYSTMIDVNSRILPSLAKQDRLISLCLMPVGLHRLGPVKLSPQEYGDDLLHRECESRVERVLGVTNNWGWGCSGSWLVGLKDTVTAPAVGRSALAQLTSLVSAEQRAAVGAGFPSRNDFYRHYGRRSVKGLDGCCWFDVLAYRAFTRRRDRSAINTEDRARFIREVNQILSAIMSTAAMITEQSHWMKSVRLIEEWWKKITECASVK